MSTWRCDINDGTYGRVFDDFHAPTKLGHEILVGEGTHVTMCPCVNGNVALKVVESAQKEVCVVQNVDADHKVRRALVVRL